MIQKSKPINGYIDEESSLLEKREKYVREEKEGEEISFGPPSLIYIVHQATTMFGNTTQQKEYRMNTFHHLKGMTINKARSLISYFSKRMKEREETGYWISNLITTHYEIKNCKMRIYNPFQQCDLQLKIDCASKESMVKETLIDKEGNKRECLQNESKTMWEEIFISEVSRTLFFYLFLPKTGVEKILSFPLFYDEEKQEINVHSNIDYFLVCVGNLFQNRSSSSLSRILELVFHSCYLLLKKYGLYEKIVNFFSQCKYFLFIFNFF